MMPKNLWRPVIGCLIVLTTACASLAAGVTDDDIQASIDRGVAWLWTQQRPNGWFSDRGWFGYGNNVPQDRRMPGAHTSMAMMALTFTQTSINDPRMLKSFDALLKFELKHTYTIAPRMMVISRLLRKLDRERRQRALRVLKADVKWMQEAQNGLGAWGYNYESRLHDTYGWDLSNTQMAVLGLSEAEMAGIEIDPKVMLKVQKLYLDRQRDDGGWNYGMRGGFQAKNHPDGPKVGSYGSMTAAAVATLFITRDFLYRGIGCPCKNQKSGRRPKKLDAAIDRGLDWLGEHFEVKVNPLGLRFNWKYYWLYSCERVGLAAGLKYFGTHDWYREGATEIIGTQQPDGSWSKTVWTTAYALCFLAKGRAPILFNKLKFKGQWNNHPRDLRNLTRYVGNRKEQHIAWQVINTKAPVAEWHDAPILYISAETRPEFSDQELQKLRRFTDSGGTILFEASCGNRLIANWWRNMVKKLWPEWELKRIDRNHPLWTADVRMRKLPPLWGMSDGLRTFIFFSNRDISCPWNTMAMARNRPLFDLGTNLYIYATDHRPLRARLAATRTVAAGQYAGTTLSAGGKSELTMARVSHGGDWYVGRHYRGLALLAAALGGPDRSGPADELEKAVTQPGAGSRAAAGPLKVKVLDPVEAAKLSAETLQVAYLAGRQEVSLNGPQIAALKAYLAGGGFLLAEAVMGDKRFDAAFRQLAPQLGLRIKWMGKDSPLVSGQMEGATGYRLDKMKYRHALKAERIGKLTPRLAGLYLGDRLVGVYSPFDLLYSRAGYDAWRCRGYAAEDARAILTNILLLASTR